MTPSVFDRANAVGKYAAKLIFDLQRELRSKAWGNMLKQYGKNIRHGM